MYQCSALEIAPSPPTPSHINGTRSVTLVVVSKLKWPGWAGWREQRNKVFPVLSAIYLVHPKPGTVTGANLCPCQYAGFLTAFQWLHNMFFPPCPKSGQLSLLHITGICAEEHPAYIPGKLCSWWKWAVAGLQWLSHLALQKSIRQKSFQYLLYGYSLFLASGTVLESAICIE